MSKDKLAHIGRILFIAVVFAVGCETEKNDFDQNFKDDLEFWSSAQNRPIQEIVAQTFVLQNTEALMVATRVAGEMQSPPYTVFTPWDIAFEKLPYWDKMTSNRAWYGHLRDLLLGHIHQGNISKADLTDGMTVAMVNGDVGTVSLENDRARVDGILTIAETAARDGYLYMIDAVRPPGWTTRTVLDVINTDERFSKLAEILSHPSLSAKREELGSTQAELTFFAPTNEALDGFNMEQCAESDCSALFTQLVENHLVGAVIPKMFTPTQNLATEAGASLAWNFDTQNISCTNGDDTVEEFGLGGFEEEYASNGIVQPIDALLCTDMDTCGDSRVTECAEEQQCGVMDDGCGGTINCGFCGGGQNCVNHRCVNEDTNISAFFDQSAYGAHELLVFNIKCVSGNCQETKTQKMWENLSTPDVEEAFFGDQPYSASSWYSDCSNDQFRFAPSSYGGVIDVELDASDVVNGDGHARRQFNETFGLNPGDAVEHVVFCFPRHRRGGNITIAPIYDGLPKGSTVWLSHGHCVDAGFILHELGHSIGLKHAGAFQENGNIGAYSDNTDIMGGALTGPQCFNGTNLWKTGWYRDKAISLMPVEGGSLDVTIATMRDRDRAALDEHIVVKLGDYYLRYNVRQTDEFPDNWSSRGQHPEAEMDKLVTITKAESPISGVKSVLYAGIDVGSTYRIENFNGTDALFVKGCARSDGDGNRARSMTVSIGYDEWALCDGQCPDSDGDQISDCEDRCPFDENKTERGLCGCGISDADSDGDGRPDCTDRCPNDANKVHPLQCGCGVPEGSCGPCVNSSPTWCEGNVIEYGFCFREGPNTDYVRRKCCKTCFIDLRDQW